MNADQFYNEIKSLIPNVKDVKKYVPYLEEEYTKSVEISPLKKSHGEFPLYPVVDLIARYKIENFCIQNFSFVSYSELSESDKYLIFGWREAFLLGIDKDTDEIIELDWSDPDTIISYVAKDESHYLDFLIELFKLNKARDFEEISNQTRNQCIDKLVNIVGGEKYLSSLEELKLDTTDFD